MMVLVGWGFTTAPLWVLLFALMQSIDVFTTAIDRSKGAVEAEPLSNWLISQQGVVGFWILKLTLVIAVGGVLLLAVRWARGGGTAARRLYRVVILAVQVVTTLLAVVSLQNALLSTYI
jgi:hypothetical protein